MQGKQDLLDRQVQISMIAFTLMVIENGHPRPQYKFLRQYDQELWGEGDCQNHLFRLIREGKPRRL